MNEMLASVFTIALLVVIVLFALTLFKSARKINTRFFKTTNRKKLSVYYLGIVIILFVLIGMTAPPQDETNQKASTPSQVSKEIPETDTVIEDTEDAIEKQGQEKVLSELYPVTKVVDGDTIDVNIEGKIERLRLIGIDTPETVDPRKPVQCFGREASNKAKELLEGKKVRLESDETQDNRDKYDRLLRYVYLEDGTSYNKLIIMEGYAHEYTYNIPYKYQSEYKQAQKEAEVAQRGLWSPSTCNGNTSQTEPQDNSPSTTQTAPKPQSTPQQSGNCDPNYTPCIPNVGYDLNCSDIRKKVQVIGTDRHRLDRDGDGYGCESY